MPVAAVIAVAAVASIAAGAMEAKEKKKAANKQVQVTDETNAENYRRYQEARGQGGNAILPLYLPEGTEADMAKTATEYYNAIADKPVDMVEAYKAIINEQLPSITAGDQAINDIFSGALEQQRLGREEPVAAARTGLADSQSQAINTGLVDRLNAMAAADALKGYTGTSSFAQNRMLQATIAARQAAAAGKANATLANALAQQRIGDESSDLKLRSLDSPINRMNQEINAINLPYAALVNRLKTGQSALDFFRIGTGNPPQAVIPTITATPSMGGVIASGIAQGAGAYGNYLAQKDLANQIYGGNRIVSASPYAGDSMIDYQLGQDLVQRGAG